MSPKKDAYWHSFYFVPKENREYLLHLLYQIRKICNYFSQMHYQKIKLSIIKIWPLCFSDCCMSGIVWKFLNILFFANSRFSINVGDNTSFISIFISMNQGNVPWFWYLVFSQLLIIRAVFILKGQVFSFS